MDSRTEASATAADSGGRLRPCQPGGLQDQDQQPAQSEQAEDAHPLADLRLHAARGRLPGLLVALLDHRLRRFQQVGLAVVRVGELSRVTLAPSSRWAGRPAREPPGREIAMSIGLVM